MKKTGFYIKGLINLILVVSLLLCGCGSDSDETTKKEKESGKEVTNQESGEGTTTMPETEPVNPEDLMYSYLTGEPVNKAIGNRRPVAIAYNNIKDAVPQTGISRADVVIEAQVEGGITRLLGIMENYDDLEKIGSVRSARPHYIYESLEFDAIYVHFGQCAYALDLINQGIINNINGYFGQGNFYRTTDRVAPHNAYTSGAGLNQSISSLYRTNYVEGYTGHYNFAEYGTTIDLADGVDANNIRCGFKYNSAGFTYNAEDQLYYRNQFGEAQIDDLTGQQLSYTNVILQYCNWSYYSDNYRVKYDLNSGGGGKFITRGKAIDVTWSKGEDGITHYYDGSGNEITLNTGKTWVCLVFNNQLNYVSIS